MRRILWVLSVSFMPVGLAPSLGQSLTHCVPPAVGVGATTRVTCYGSDLSSVQTLWTSFPAEVKLVTDPKPTDKQITFDVTIKKDTAVGKQLVRLASGSAFSEPRLLFVEDLPIAVETSENKRRQSAQTATIPVAVGGVMEPQTSDFYTIDAVAGQSVSIEVQGQRLGTDFDPLVRILDSDGKEVMYHDNTEGIGFDPHFRHRFAKAGKYTLELLDARNQGGANWAYLLRIGDFPIGLTSFPTGAASGQTTQFLLPASEGWAPKLAPMPKDSGVEQIDLVAPGVAGSSPIRLSVETGPTIIEQEPNNSIAAASPVTVPITIFGRLLEEKDIDYLRLTAKKGEAITIAADTRRLHSKADLVLRVLDQKGAVLATADDTGVEEGTLTWTPPADGEYFLSIEDLLRRGGPEFVYRVEFSTKKADFSVELGSSALVVPQGGSAPTLLSVKRTGAVKEVDLALNDAPTGLGISPTASNDASGVLLIAADAKTPLGTHTVTLMGSAMIGDDRRVKLASIEKQIAPGLAGLIDPPLLATRQVPILVTPPAGVQLAIHAPYESIGRFLKTKFKVYATRKVGVDEEITLKVENALPVNVGLTAPKIAAGASETELEFSSSGKAPLGDFPVILSGTIKQNGVPTKVYANVLQLKLVPAYRLETEPATVTLKAKEEAKLTLRAHRLTGYDGPITVALAGYPKGVSGPTSVKLDGKATTAEVTLKAVDSFEPTTGTITLKGTATVGGSAESVTGTPLKVTLK